MLVVEPLKIHRIMEKTELRFDTTLRPLREYPTEASTFPGSVDGSWPMGLMVESFFGPSLEGTSCVSVVDSGIVTKFRGFDTAINFKD